MRAYSHKENATVERASKEVMRHLDSIIFDARIVSQCFKYLLVDHRVMNSQIHESIGVSPAALVFDNTLTLDRDILPQQHNQMKHINYHSKLKKLLFQQH